jgi:glycosyltransferase involved in cell wall biosynthesis
MRVLFDYQAFEMQRFGGVSRSYAEIISYLQAEDVSCMVGLKESDNAYIELPRLNPLHYTHAKYFGGEKWFKGQRRLTRMLMQRMGHANDGLNINQEYCIKLLKQQQFDIFEPTFFSPYFLPYLKGKPFVLQIHDMIPEICALQEDINTIQIKQKQILCPLATKIRVPSQKTKEDIINILSISPEKISVIPHGIPSLNYSQKHSSRFDFPYLLYVGERSRYKNFYALLHELSIILGKEPDIHLVCTGRSFCETELKEMDLLQLGNRVHQLFADADTLTGLYQNAKAFVFPSSYEGFGLPILEAFSCGCPVFLNNASCFPEIAGDAAIYFDIKKKGDFAEHFIHFLQSSRQDKEDQITKGHLRVKEYSWEKSAKLLSNLYKELL